MTPSDSLRFKLYEQTIQSPQWTTQYLPQFHQWLHKKNPLSFREDFCGTGAIAVEWAKLSPKHTASGLDINPVALKYAKTHNLAQLPPSLASRIELKKQNVLTPTARKFDMIGAFNYSYFVFHQRALLLKYFKSVHASLNSKGTFFLDVAGGPGFIESHIESETFQLKDIGEVTQFWEQQDMDPVTSLNHYAIHFKLESGKWLKNAFKYHWRVWGISELRELLTEAGFDKTVVLWPEPDKKGEPTDYYVPSERGTALQSWNAFVVGVKKPT